MQDAANQPEPTRIHLRQLKLAEFRNYGALALDLDERHVVLTGENGSGKTNLLEAVSFLSPGRGLRRAPYDRIARSGGDGSWSVFARLCGACGEAEIGTGITSGPAGPESQRRVRINGAAAKSGEVLLEHSRITWITPAMDGLFTGPAGDRRRFLDRMVLAIDPGHGRRVADYEKAMRGRNRLLGEETLQGAWLDAVETQMAELGVAIASARAEFATLLGAAIIRGNEPGSPFPDAVLALDGTLESSHGDMAASDLEGEYADRLRNQRMIDRAAGRTLEGPHRSDLLVRHGPKNMPAELCSTGEQKALLVGLVLAHARMTAEMTGHAPILLLDEIAAHLDERRRGALFDLIDSLDCQAFMTGTDTSLFAALGKRGLFFNVDGGTIREEKS